MLQGQIGEFCRTHSISVADLAKKLGLSAAQLYQVADGRAKQRSIYRYALKGLAVELSRQPQLRVRPAAKEPPFNRERIRCPIPTCGRKMFRGNETKNPDTGQLLWRMFCKGERSRRHQTVFTYVDRNGNSASAPSKRHRRKLAPFEKREGLAKCAQCEQDLQWQEIVENRWGHKKLYCYRCTNYSGPCRLAGRRVYRDATGRSVERDVEWRLKGRKARITDRCPVCKGRLWKAGTYEKGNLIKLHCREGVRTKGVPHFRNGLRYPGVFYHRPGRSVLYVHGTKRTSSGRRQFMRLLRWEKQQRKKLTPEDFLKQVGEKAFTIVEFGLALGIHAVTAGDKLLDLEREGRIIACENRSGRKKVYQVRSPSAETKV